MRIPARAIALLAVIVMRVAPANPAAAQVLTVDRAVQIALDQSPDILNARASVLDAKSGLYGASSAILPHVSGFVSRTNNVQTGIASPLVFGGVPTGGSLVRDFESHGTTPGVSGSWSVLNFSGLAGFSSARSGLAAARQRLLSSRNDIAFGIRQQFYAAVTAIHLVGVQNSALKLARDNERRVRALFEVGSVSRSDVLKAQVNTAQSELDSVSAEQQVVVQRALLASRIGLDEARLGAIDTSLTVTRRDYDEAALLADAEHHRPDLMAAEASVRSARAAKTSARLLRFPYVSFTGSHDLKSTTHSTSTIEPPGDPAEGATPGSRSFGSTTDRASSWTLSLNWDLIDGLSADSRNASATAALLRAEATRDALRRNLASDVHQALVAYLDALAQEDVAEQAYASADENLKLTQQKYNVGSSTILDLVDAQVQLQRAASQRVTAAAAIRVAEAQLDRVRGKQE